jgi:hypothetical protein
MVNDDFSSNLLNMGGAYCTHYLIFNDDGFEVCQFCGKCGSMRDMRGEVSDRTELINKKSEFSDILINNHIGFVSEIESEYGCLKSKLKRGYSNITLYAYCAYIVLLKHKVYYSLEQISNIFKIPHFQKVFCQIEKNQYVKKYIFDTSNIDLLRSSMFLCLSNLEKGMLIGEAERHSQYINKNHPKLKTSFIISSSLYFTISPILLSKRASLLFLSKYFSVNVRTLEKTIKNIEKQKKGKE